MSNDFKQIESIAPPIEIVQGPEILVPKKNIILDATVLSALMMCARFTDLRFNHSLVSINGKSNSLECGSIVHEFLETLYRCRAQGIKYNEAVAIAYASAQLYIAGCQYCTDFTPTHHDYDNSETHVCNDQCILKPKCGHAPNKYPGVKNTPQEPSAEKPYQVGWNWVLTTCEQYAEYYKNDHWITLEVEVVKSKILYEDDEIRILWKSKLDWIVDTNQGIYPVDHKTMKQNRSTTVLNNQFMGQAIMMGTRGVVINKVGFQKTLPLEKRFVRPIMPYTNDGLLEWQSQTLPFYGRMLLAYTEMDYWPPNHSNCQGKFGDCIFLKGCEADRQNREQWLKDNFIVGPAWDPTNDTTADED